MRYVKSSEAQITKLASALENRRRDERNNCDNSSVGRVIYGGKEIGIGEEGLKEDYTPGMLIEFERIPRSLLLWSRRWEWLIGTTTWMRIEKRRNKIFASPRGRPQKVRR